MPVISSHEHKQKQYISERNVCYLLICKEGPLALHIHLSHCKIFLRLQFLVVLYVLYNSLILSSCMNKYLAVQIH